MPLRPPPPAEWACSMTRDFACSMQVMQAPNWFHRFMRKLVFGIRWRRL